MPRGRPCAQQLQAPSGWNVTRGGALEGTAQATQVKAPQAPRFPLTPTLCAPMRLLSPDLSPGWGARAGAHTDRVSPWHRPNTARNPRRWTWNEAKGHGGVGDAGWGGREAHRPGGEWAPRCQPRGGRGVLHGKPSSWGSDLLTAHSAPVPTPAPQASPAPGLSRLECPSWLYRPQECSLGGVTRGR